MKQGEKCGMVHVVGYHHPLFLEKSFQEPRLFLCRVPNQLDNFTKFSV